MPNVRSFALAVLLGSVVAAASPALGQTTLTMSSWVSPQHHLTANVLQGWATEAEKATSGRVKFTMLPKHPSAPPGTFDAVRDGLVDLSFVTASYTPARHILPLLPELPGSGDTALVNSVAYSRIHWKYFQKVGEYKGVKLLGVFTPLESIISFKLDTVLEQATLFPGGMYSSAFGFFMNEDKWNKLPKQDQDAIEKISGEHIARLAGKSWDEADQKGMDALKKSGVKIVNANSELVAEVKKRSAPIVDDWIKKASAKGIEG